MYKKSQPDLPEKYNGKIIAVADGKAIGDYPTILSAYREMEAMGVEEGEYIIINCTPGDSEYFDFFANWQLLTAQSATQRRLCDSCKQVS